MTQRLKVFLSWAGEPSKSVALYLREWLPLVLQNAEPWCSDMDIDKGMQWFSQLTDILESSRFGIIILTPDNLLNPWIHYEAGALWKAVSTQRICPFLFGINSASDVKPPLGLFQSALASNKDEVKKMIKSINALLSETNGQLSETNLDKSFEMWWPQLESKLAEIAAAGLAGGAPRRDPADVTLEILEHVRGISRRIEEGGFALASAVGKSVAPEIRAEQGADPKASPPDVQEKGIPEEEKATSAAPAEKG